MEICKQIYPQLSHLMYKPGIKVTDPQSLQLKAKGA